MITISIKNLIIGIVIVVILTSLVLLFAFSIGETNQKNKVYDEGYAAGLKENIRAHVPKRIQPEQANYAHEAAYIKGWNDCRGSMLLHGAMIHKKCTLKRGHVDCGTKGEDKLVIGFDCSENDGTCLVIGRRKKDNIDIINMLFDEEAGDMYEALIGIKSDHENK